MKTLLLLRHAKPSPTSPTGDDRDRPLVAEGRTQASGVGQLLIQQQLTPGRIICSTAVRARETISLVSEAASLTAAPGFDARLYNADAERVLEVVSEVEDEAGTVLVVGHNPGLAELITLLTGESKSMSPATLARLDLDIEEWGEPLTAAGRLVFALPPEAPEEN